jgi:hypothetical protein
MMEHMAMVNTEPLLSQDQELALLRLAREIYSRNNWPGFYENAACYGLQQCHSLLVHAAPGDSNALRNNLLLCCIMEFTMRTHNMASYLLNQGADPDWLGLIPVVIKGQLVHFPTPLLGCLSSIKTRDCLARFSRQGKRVFKDVIQIFLAFGADPLRKFLSYESCSQSGCVERPRKSPRSRIALDTRMARPIRWCFHVGYHSYNLITERNCVDVMLEAYANGDNIPRDSRDRGTLSEIIVELASKFGLYIEKAHRKVLLYFGQDAVYRADDEDSEAINKILGWPGTLLGNRTPRELEELDEQHIQIRELLKGKEVTDVVQWLTDRGHMVQQSGIPEKASVHEVAEIYQKLNKKFRPELLA